MIDYLKDITAHTFSLGGISLIKVTGTEADTIVESMSDDRAVIIKAKLRNPVPELIGQFGMPNLDKLNTIFNIAEYKDDAKITTTSQTREGVDTLTGLHFENKDGDFKIDYRFMSTELVNSKLKTVRFNGAKWDVTVVPTAKNIQRMRFMAAANSEEPAFIAQTNGSNQLTFFFGDHSTHAGNFVFAEDVVGTLANGSKMMWPVVMFNTILALSGDKEIMFSDSGVALITVDSGLATYEYYIPAKQK